MADLPLRDLDGPCGSCGRPAGDHTLREWSVCVGAAALDLPYLDEPDDVLLDLRKRFGLDDDVLVADHVVAKALVLDGSLGGQVGVRLPAVLQEFAVGRPGGAPSTVARVLLLGSDEVIGKYGVLARDTARGAVNAVRRMNG